MLVSEATKYLVSGKDGDHLPYTNENGTPDHRLMGAAWAALHGGYRGNKYDGPNKDAAIAKLKAVYKSEKMDTPEESDRSIFAVGATESYDASKGVAKITIIKPGVNKSKTRNYPVETLKRDFKVFEGAKMFADHATEAERKARPEGSVNNWVGVLKNVAPEESGVLHGDAHIVDPVFKAKLDRLNEAGLLGEMGVSIRAVGTATKAKLDGVTMNNMESIDHALSVDFVTFPGAGGRVEALESAAVVIDESVDYEITPKKGTKTMLTEAEVKMLQDKVAALEAENTTLKTKAAESEKQARIAAVQSTVAAKLQESKLPQAAKDRIKKQFEASESCDTLADVIKNEEAYIKSLGAAGVVNMGESHSGEAAGDPAKAKQAQYKSYRRMGFTESEAKIAAGI